MTELEMFTEEWVKVYREAIARNAAYRASAAKWEGSVGLLVRPHPAKGIATERGVLLDLHHGECREATAPPPEAVRSAADFVIDGDFATWKEVIEGRLDPLKGLMFGKLRLRKGSLVALIPYTKASQELVKSAREVPTRL